MSQGGRSVKIPEFESDSLSDFFVGLGNGMIDVLPDESFLTFCRGNITQIGDGSEAMADDFDTESYSSMLEELQNVLEGFGGATFNCFYSVRDPAALGPSGYDLTLEVIGWNILYNLGYMYNDIFNIDKYVSSSANEAELLGESIGDLSMRFFYSRYIPTRYINDWLVFIVWDYTLYKIFIL